MLVIRASCDRPPMPYLRSNRFAPRTVRFCAIFCATVNNFAWNRKWTWADRRRRNARKSLLLQFGQYALACWFSIGLQVVFTKILTGTGVYYLVSNLSAIILASIVTFAINDLWAFGRMKSMSIARNRNRSGEDL